MIEVDFDKVEYGYDENGEKFELSSSFKDGPDGAQLISCPICHACKNEYYDKATDKLSCKIKGDLPEELIFGDVYYCNEFTGEETRHHYKFVMEEIKNYNK